MIEEIRDIEVFTAHVQAWVDRIADPRLTGAWTIVKAFIQIMAEAEVDDHGGDLSAALRENWTFFVAATMDEPSSLLHLGIVDNMVESVPRPTDMPFLAIIDEAYDLARQSQGRRRAKTGAAPRLVVLPGGCG